MMMNYNNNDNNQSGKNDLFSNFLNLLSSAIGLENLEENRFQAQQNQKMLQSIVKQTTDFDIRLTNIENTLQKILNKLDP